MELAYPPFETKDEQGNPTGVSVDFAKAFGEHVGREVVIENISWDGLIPAVQTQQVDFVVSSMTIKEERLEKVDFSKPYAKALLAMLVKKDSDIQSMKDFDQPGRSIAVKIGSSGHMYAQNNLQSAEIIALPDESACVTEVTQGKADGFIYDQLTIYRNNKEHPDTTRAIFIPFQDVEYWGVAVKKGNEELLNQMNGFIDEFYADGGFDRITEKYLKEEKEVFDELGFEWFFSDLNEQ
ncbi:MAG TPA: amino acid ABC transporter substrate-binding protein [Eubacteriaceae bacterium]|nr:amino acid ABC transporter substrate-binding protein [Eubacteriaceae bacterium]